MLVAPTMATVVRSSLEVMLESLKKRDEKPPDSMPALPVRPVSRGRLPSSKRSLLMNSDTQSNGGKEVKKQEVISKGAIFGGGKVLNGEPMEESPYSKMLELESYEERRPEEVEVLEPPTSPSRTMRIANGKNLECVLRKVWPLILLVCLEFDGFLNY